LFSLDPSSLFLLALQALSLYNVRHPDEVHDEVVEASLKLGAHSIRQVFWCPSAHQKGAPRRCKPVGHCWGYHTNAIMVRQQERAGLLKPSVLKPVLTTIDPALVLKKLGRLTATEQAALRQALSAILG
jgi:hypothetical protein